MNYKEILKQLEEYYSNLLIIQYNGKQKAKATIELMARLVWSNMALMQIRDAFDWKTADDAQLDIIGQWVGVSREYTGDATWDNAFLAYPSWDDTTDSLQGGYTDYPNFDDDEGAVLTYEQLDIYKNTLSPEDYRTVIGLKIIKNNIAHNQGEIDKAIALYFAEKDADGNVIYDNDGYIANPLVYTTWQPHRLTYHYDASLSTIINICNKKGVLPCPTGCEIYLSVI